MRLSKFLSRISIRLMAFNILLIFLPVAGILYLATYEEHLLDAEKNAMLEQADILAGSLAATGGVNPAESRQLLASVAMARRSSETRVRVIDRARSVVADSEQNPAEKATRPQTASSPARRNWLYRFASFILRPFARLLIRPPEEPLETGDYYERATRLDGSEIESALGGKHSTTQRRSPGGQRSVILYAAAPVRTADGVIGAVLVSRSTYRILQDLYQIRLGIVQIFAVSVLVGALLSLWVATTIVRPLQELRLDAKAILDQRGRLKGRFRGSKKHDEIGSLSRALERLTRRLEEHLQFIESFASDVSHEFKNPLASIRAATEMLSEVEDPIQRSRFLRMVEQDVARMEHLLTGVREITRIDAQLATEKREAVTIQDLVGQLVDGFQLRLRDRVKFTISAPDTPLQVFAAADRLGQVFENVLDNAVSFSPAGGTIHIDMLSEQGTIVVRMRDEGPGIPEEHIERIFTRFFTYRPHKEPTTSKHTGLGLSIVQAIVQGYGGSVSAHNAPNGGAMFEIRLPEKKP